MCCNSQYFVRDSLMNELSLSVLIPTVGKGNRFRSSSIVSTTSDCSRISIGTHSVQPEPTSVAAKLWMNAPERLPPQCATKSASRLPGATSSHSEKVLTAIAARIFFFGRTCVLPVFPISCIVVFANGFIDRDIASGWVHGSYL